MAQPTIGFRPDLGAYLSCMSGPRLAVLIYLMSADDQMPLSLSLLSRQTGYGVEAVSEALDWLKQPTASNERIHPFIRIQKDELQLSRHWIGTPTNKRYAYTGTEDDDQAHVLQLEKRIQQLSDENARLKAGTEGALTKHIHGAEGDLIQYAETLLGGPLGEVRAYYFGKMLQRFGPERVRWAINQKSSAQDPLRYAYALLSRKVRGEGFKQEVVQVEQVRYTEVPIDYQPA